MPSPKEPYLIITDDAPPDDERIPESTEPLPGLFIGYRGERQPDGTGKLYRIEKDYIGPEAKETKIEIPIEPSQALRHDADSFDWGNSGPGTTQTALAILIDFGCSDHGALAVQPYLKRILSTENPYQFHSFVDPLFFLIENILNES